MPVKKGTNSILPIYKGTNEIGKIYRGTNLVFEKETGPQPDYLNFMATEDGTQICLNKVGNAPTLSIQYSFDRKKWYNYTQGIKIRFLANDKIYFKGNNTSLASSTSAYNNFSISKPVYASGNAISLLDETMQPISLGNYAFYGLFKDCTNLLTCPYFSNCSITTGSAHFGYIFSGCSNLTTLPSIQLDDVTVSTIFSTTIMARAFENCSKIKVSTTQSEEYSNVYRVPPSGSIKNVSISTNSFLGTGGTYTSGIKTAQNYYTANEVVYPPTN